MARSFNGSTQYLYRGSAVVTSVPLTMCCWFKKSSLTTDSCILYAENQSTQSYVGLFARSTAVNGNKIQGIVVETGIGSAVVNGSTYAANEWHFAAIRCDSSTSRAIYYDTTKTSDTTSITLSSTLDELAVGVWHRSSIALHFDGSIAEVGCWNAALDDSELAALSDGYTPDGIRPQSLLAYYELGGKSGQYDVDRWKNKYDLTPNGSPTWSADHPAVISRRRRFWFDLHVQQATAYTLTVDAATVNVTGQSVTLKANRNLTVSNASVQLAGQAATVAAQRNLTVGNAALTATGQGVAVSSSRSVSVNNASVSLNGQDATLSAQRNVTVNNASLSVTGQAASLTSARSVQVGNGSVSVSGQSTALTSQRSVSVGNASLALTGQDVLLRRAVALAIDAAQLSLTGQAVVLTWSGEPSGDYDYTPDCETVALARPRVLVARTRGRLTTAIAQGRCVVSRAMWRDTIAHADKRATIARAR